MSFFTELKRRNVVKVGLAYAIVAWLLIQITDIVAPALRLPDWTITFIVYLLIIGFALAIFLTWAYELTPEGIRPTAAVQSGARQPRTTGHRLNYIILGLVVLAVGFILVDNYVLVDRPSTTASSIADSMSIVNQGLTGLTTTETAAASTPVSTTSPVRRYSVMLGDTQSMTGSLLDAIFTLSRDGRHLVYSVLTENSRRMFYRPLDQLTAKELPNTGNNTYSLFFSPDGEWIGYSPTAGGGLYKRSVQGGPPQQLTPAMDFARGGFWTPDDVIYFSANNKLHRIPASGGTPEPVPMNSDLSERIHSWPYVLPGGEHLLLTVHSGAAAEDGQIASLSLKTGESRILVGNGYNARYVPTGHLIFMRTESLWAIPFDLGRLETRGTAVPVVNGIQTETLFGTAVYAYSDDGLLVYLPGGNRQGENILIGSPVWVDRQGNETRMEDLDQSVVSLQLSPDEKQIALGVTSDLSNMDVWTYDIDRGTTSRRTFTENSMFPVWTPDGAQVIYGYWPAQRGLSVINADGTGQPEYLSQTQRALIPTSLSPDGVYLAYYEVLSNANDIFILSMAGERTEQPLIATEFSECCADISPDGKWIVYASDETGRSEIYVRPFPDVEGGKWQVSNNGGQEPRWRGDGRELYYIQPSGSETVVSAVAVDTEPRFIAHKPEVLFTGNYNTPLANNYDVSADGQRFVMLKPAGDADNNTTVKMTSLVVVDNWFEELKRLAPPAR